MRTTRVPGSSLCLAGTGLAAVLGLTGCLVLPIPGSASKAPYTSEQLDQVKEGTSTRKAIEQTLGAPDLAASQGRFWVYDWAVTRGHLLVAALPVGGGVAPLSSTDHVLFLEFDDHDVLRRKAFGERAKQGPKDVFSTPDGLRVEHRLPDSGEPDGAPRRGFVQNRSAFTIIGDAKAAVPWPVLAPDQGAVVLWLKPEDWDASRGLNVAIGNLAEGTWLPVGAYVVIPLPAGEHVVSLTSPWTKGTFFHPLDPGNLKSSAKLRCESGRVTYLEIGAHSKTYGKELPAVLTPLEPGAGQQTIAGLARMLQP